MSASGQLHLLLTHRLVLLMMACSYTAASVLNLRAVGEQLQVDLLAMHVSLNTYWIHSLDPCDWEVGCQCPCIHDDDDPYLSSGPCMHDDDPSLSLLSLFFAHTSFLLI